MLKDLGAATRTSNIPQLATSIVLTATLITVWGAVLTVGFVLLTGR